MKRSGKFFVVYASKKESNEDRRIDIVIGLNVSKKAVVRNKIKRQIREIVRRIDLTKSAASLKIVVLPSIVNIKFSDIKTSLTEILSDL
ncbi:MAG: ribonuclease P protein component [bacterium]|nr:ribonuclease P protein component [bacterium]